MTHSNEQIIAYLQGKLTPQERATLLEEAQHDEALRKAIMAQMETSALLFLHESQADVEEGQQQLRTFKTRLRAKDGYTPPNKAGVMLPFCSWACSRCGSSCLNQPPLSPRSACKRCVYPMGNTAK